MLKYALAASAAVAAIVALSAPSYADPDTATVQINGTVGAACSLGGLNIQPIDFGTIQVDQDDKVLAGQHKEPTFGEVWCNGMHNSYTVTANPLANTTNTATPPSGFTNRVDYTLTTPLAPGSLDSASNTPATGSNQGAFFISSGTGVVTLDTGTQQVVAGDYQGTVNISVTPGT